MSILDMVKGKKARFVRYMDGALWYETDDGFEFPITTDEAKGGVFHAEHKAIELMRWIRKHKNSIEQEQQ